MLQYTPKSLLTIKWLFIIIIMYAIVQKLNGIRCKKLLTKSFENIHNKTKHKHDQNKKTPNTVQCFLNNEYQDYIVCI